MSNPGCIIWTKPSAQAVTLTKPSGHSDSWSKPSAQAVVLDKPVANVDVWGKPSAQSTVWTKIGICVVSPYTGQQLFYENGDYVQGQIYSNMISAGLFYSNSKTVTATIMLAYQESEQYFFMNGKTIRGRMIA